MSTGRAWGGRGHDECWSQRWASSSASRRALAAAAVDLRRGRGHDGGRAWAETAASKCWRRRPGEDSRPRAHLWRRGSLLISGGATPSPRFPPHHGDLERWSVAVVGSARLILIPSSPRPFRSSPPPLRIPSAAPRRAELESAEEGATTPPPPQHCRRHDTPAPSLSQHGALAGGHNLLGGGGFPDVTSSSTS